MKVPGIEPAIYWLVYLLQKINLFVYAKTNENEHTTFHSGLLFNLDQDPHTLVHIDINEWAKTANERYSIMKLLIHENVKHLLLFKRWIIAL